MRLPFLAAIAALLFGSAASAGTINYNTTGSTLSCNGVAGCVQNTSTSVTLGGLTFTYNAGSGSGVVTPSILNFGNIVATGTSTGTPVTGLVLTINVNSTPPGASGTLPNGSFAGSIATNDSGATISFGPNNTTTAYGTLPGVVISGANGAFTYQVLNTSLGLQAPTVGNPVGQTSIQGAVTDTSPPQPSTVSYNTTGSTLSCNGVSGCVQNTSTSVTIGGLTFTYNAGSGSGVAPPSIINFGNLVATGTSAGTTVTGLLLTINVNSTPPGASGTLPNGAITGTVSTNNSTATLTFSPNNTTTAFGTLPGIVISGASGSFTYQILNASLGVQAPTVGNPVGQTSIQGAVSANPSSITATAGSTPQSAPTGAAFANALSVTVQDVANHAVSGASVTFTAPGSGASGVFSNNTNTITVTSNASGVASAPFTANATAGSYSVTASTPSVPNVTFALTNTGAASSMVANAGTTPQSATVGFGFANAPAVTVKDASGDPVSGVSVVFTAPGSGASGAFGNGTQTITVTTNAAGVASAPFVANSTAGGAYTVTAAASGLTTVNFSLTNLAKAGTTISYNTTGSTLSCNGVAGCVQNTSTSVTIGGLTFTYNAGSGSGVSVPSIINLGNLVSTGTSSGSSVAGLLLTINVNSTPPGASGTLPNGAASGVVSTNNSGATILFSPNNTTTPFGTLPGVVISGGTGSFTYQVLNTSLGLQASTVGNPVGQTSIQGAVSSAGASTMVANPGTTPQSTSINTAFANALAVTVANAASAPIPGVNVTFTAPASGASGSFSNSTNTITVATNASGVASAPFTANGTAGSAYSVVASASGLPNVTFSLSNVGPASMTANPGTTPQSATINTSFTNALGVTVRDAGSNPVSGVDVTFNAPASGASGLFSNNTTSIVVTTNASGVASAPFTANGIEGAYSASAAVTGLTPVTFSLTNSADTTPTTITPAAGTTPQSATTSTAFAHAPAVIIGDADGNPVSGASVTFTAPASGASGVFSNNTNSIVVLTNAAGVASAPFTADATQGSYTVTATVIGTLPLPNALPRHGSTQAAAAATGPLTATFALTNTAAAPPAAVLPAPLLGEGATALLGALLLLLGIAAARRAQR